MYIRKKNHQEKIENYLTDESNMIKGGMASKIFFPRTEREVIEIVEKSKKYNTTITISGGGTGVAGGRVPLSGWIIATDKMLSIKRGDRKMERPKYTN